MKKRLSEQQADFLEMINDLLNFIYPQLDGYLLKVTYWNRTVEEQEKLRREELSQIKESKHLIGLAVDFALIKDNEFLTNDSLYKTMGDYWESLGGTWGGNWKFNDVYHFEYNEKKREEYLTKKRIGV